MLAAVVVALLIRFFVIEAYRIPSAAMRPTLEPGDTIFVSKWGYWGNRPPAPARGDVVVFSPVTENRRDYIKRVIGIPGDTVQLKGGHVLLNGEPLAAEVTTGAAETAKKAGCASEKFPGGHPFPVCWEPPVIDDFGPEKVPEGDVFLVGDLRSQGPNDTKKFKTWGVFPIATLRGRARWVWLSLESQSSGINGGWFPRFRFERMFKRIE